MAVSHWLITGAFNTAALLTDAVRVVVVGVEVTVGSGKEALTV